MRKPSEWRDLHWLLVPLDALLFAAGGYWLKALRRVGIPLAGGSVAGLYQVPWWRTLGYVLTTWGVLSFGYSPDAGLSPWHIWVGASYGLTPWWLCRWEGKWQWSHLLSPIITTLVFVGLLGLTLAFNGFPHKLFEVGVGAMHGVFVAVALQEWQQERRA